MENKVALILKKESSCIAGYPFGQRIYQEQVKGKININENFYIEIPDHIDMVASSFAQGFFSEIINEIGAPLTKKRVNIISKYEAVKNDFLNELE